MKIKEVLKQFIMKIFNFKIDNGLYNDIVYVPNGNEALNEDKIKEIKDKKNQETMNVINDFIKDDGIHNFQGEAWGSLEEIIDIDGFKYGLVKNEDSNGYNEIYAINKDTANWYKGQQRGTASGIPFIMYHFNTDEKAKTMHIDELHSFIYKNKGIGSALIAYAERQAMEENCSAINGDLSTVDVCDHNTGLVVENIKNKRHNFYTKNGYIVNEDEKGNGFFHKTLV